MEISLPVDGLERMSRTMAESVASFRGSLRKPPVKEEGEILVVTADGKGIPMRRRDDQPMVCLMDGQRSLWASSEKHLPDDMVEILDLLHVMSYLWDAAYLFHAEGSAEATAFVRDRALRILRGEVGYVIGGLRQIATKRGLSKSKQKKLAQQFTWQLAA